MVCGGDTVDVWKMNESEWCGRRSMCGRCWSVSGVWRRYSRYVEDGGELCVGAINVK